MKEESAFNRHVKVFRSPSTCRFLRLLSRSIAAVTLATSLLLTESAAADPAAMHSSALAGRKSSGAITSAGTRSMSSYSQPSSSEQITRTRLTMPDSGGGQKSISLIPTILRGGSKLTLVSPARWMPIAQKLSISLEREHQEFSTIFGEIPPFATSLRLLDEESFYQSTGAPKWTNAMYYRGQIMIPLSNEASIDFDDLTRSIKHEYTHAVIHILSAGRAPGWLDEGLAQWAEGSENPALKPALARWLQNNHAVPLALLQGGFTRLDAEMVPAAYAQSLFAARSVISSFGFAKIRTFFDGLRDGLDHPDAFKNAFGFSESTFEQGLGLNLKDWAKRYAADHGE